MALSLLLFPLSPLRSVFGGENGVRGWPLGLVEKGGVGEGIPGPRQMPLSKVPRRASCTGSPL